MESCCRNRGRSPQSFELLEQLFQLISFFSLLDFLKLWLWIWLCVGFQVCNSSIPQTKPSSSPQKQGTQSKPRAELHHGISDRLSFCYSFPEAATLIACGSWGLQAGNLRTHPSSSFADWSPALKQQKWWIGVVYSAWLWDKVLGVWFIS